MKSFSISRFLLAALIGAGLIWAGSFAKSRDEFFRDGALRALILSGRSNHDWRETTPFLRKLLEKTELFDVRVIEEPSGLTSRTLCPYDVLILDYMGPRWGEESEKAVEDFVASGKGLVVVHGASYAFSGLDVLADNHRRTGLVEAPWAEYRRMIGGVWSDNNPVTSHGDRHSFTVKIVDRNHPITMGLERSFVATDELYHDLSMESEVHILATAYSAPETRGTGEDEPILWTVSYGSGRVFHTTLGHDLVAMSEPGFVSTFSRGCEWAAAGRVSLPLSFGLDPRTEEAVRVLVVTGGHAYDTAFYSLFDGDWLRWTHRPSSREAFAADIRGEYDVLVLYDLSPELDEKGKRNLRNFVEGGKGLVVVHHALADYNTWTWWWRDVVGVRYRLGEERDASSARQGVELFVLPAEDHPITRGLGPMHLWDETYKNMWISPGATVFLRVRDESGDGPIGWVSPYPMSRVVCIQLGHYRNTLLNPGFQSLMERAIRWSGGRSGK